MSTSSSSNNHNQVPPQTRPHHELDDISIVRGAQTMDVQKSADAEAAPRRPGSPVSAPSGACDNLTDKSTSPRVTTRPTSIVFQPVAASTPKPSMSHSRSSSSAFSVPRGKRLSISIPVQPVSAPGYSPIRPSPTPAKSSITPLHASFSDATTESSDADFLVTLASQERRVFELRDELRKAEDDLGRLKKQWASIEATKKRDDLRRVQRMRPLSTPGSALDSTSDDLNGSSLWMRQEMEKRKALLSGSKKSHRTVFSGSRHTRALSLLSPEKGTFSRPFPQRADTSPSLADSRPSLLHRSSTTSDLGHLVEETAGKPVGDHGPLHQTPHQKELLLRAGRQMAADLKEGLWAFVEDLRQATVGDEGINGTRSRVAIGTPRSVSRQGSKASSMSARRRVSKGSLRRASPSVQRRTGPSEIRPLTAASNEFGDQGLGQHSPSAETLQESRDVDESPLIDVGDSFWKEHGLEEPKDAESARKVKLTRSPRKPHHPINVQTPDQEVESWDTWESPQAKTVSRTSTSSSSVIDGPPSLSIDAGSPRTSLSSNHDTLVPHDITGSRPAAQRDAIPWPVLAKLTPGHLTRTASHLMTEWENSLTPPAESGNQGVDFFWRTPSPAKDSKDTKED